MIDDGISASRIGAAQTGSDLRVGICRPLVNPSPVEAVVWRESDSRDASRFHVGTRGGKVKAFRRLFLATISMLSVGTLPGCLILDMYDQPRFEPLEGSSFFSDGMSSRRPVPGTVARGQLRDDELLETGREAGSLAIRFPFPVDESLISRGRQRFNIYCTPCHGLAGDGQGIVVQRGFKPSPSFHIDRLRQAPPGHFFEVMTQGFGVMYDYASRIRPRDRWAIVAYIRALQLSQDARLEDVPDEALSQLGHAPERSGGVHD